MNNNYNSRKRKIYSDYSLLSDNQLIEMVRKGDNYNRDVIEVIEDILNEKGIPFHDSNKTENYNYGFGSAGNQGADFKPFTQDEKIRSFIEKLRDKDPREILGTITRYSEFQTDTVEAALIVAVDRGLISYDLKNLLRNQISSNISKHWKRTGHFEWEKNNAFLELVKDCSDEEIYNILEEPSGIVIDVYHAILVTAVNRELISNEEFNNYLENAKKALRTDDQIFSDDLKDYFKGTSLEKPEMDPPDPEIEKEKYWKCPSCGSSVEMDLTVCWNCQAEMPQKIVHPAAEEIAKELDEDSKTGAAPWIILIFLFLFLIVGTILRGLIHYRHPFENKGYLIFSGILIVLAIITYMYKIMKWKS